jgi:hypothetical protein
MQSDESPGPKPGLSFVNESISAPLDPSRHRGAGVARPVSHAGAAAEDAAISTSGGGFHGDAGDERDSTAR